MSDETKQIKKIVDDETVEQMVEDRFTERKPRKRTGSSTAKRTGTGKGRRRKKKKNRMALKILITILAFILVFVISFLIAFTYMSAPEQKSNKNDQTPTTNNATQNNGSNEDKTFSSNPVDYDDQDLNINTPVSDDEEDDPVVEEPNEPVEPSTPSVPTTPSTPTTPAPSNPEPTTPSTPAPTNPDPGPVDNGDNSEGFVDGI